MQDEWTLAQSDPEQKLARLHYFSVTRGDLEFHITVHEYAGQEEDRSRRFFARADSQTDVGPGRFSPCGWGSTLVKALQECLREIDRLL